MTHRLKRLIDTGLRHFGNAFDSPRSGSPQPDNGLLSRWYSLAALEISDNHDMLQRNDLLQENLVFDITHEPKFNAFAASPPHHDVIVINSGLPLGLMITFAAILARREAFTWFEA